MKEFEELIGEWQKITKDTPLENSAISTDKNNRIMNSIIQFEKQEKQEKETSKQIGSFAVLILSLILILQTWLGNMELGTINYIGLIVLIMSGILSIILNRTDNFPDARVLPTKAYLLNVNEDLLKRRKMHLVNAIIALVLYIPGLFMAFYNLYTDSFPYGMELNWVLLIGLVIVAILGLINAIKWFRKYDKRAEPLKSEIEQMINQLG